MIAESDGLQTTDAHNDARELFASLEQIHVCAINPETGDIFGSNFETDVDAAIKFCVDYNNNGFGVYWTVNQLAEGWQGKKPKKENIVAAQFIHVDIDPSKDGSAFDKQVVADYLSEMDCAPSFVIDSGNGVQAFWRLDGPHQNLDSIEYVNRQVAQFCHADHCQNVDRLMRIPSFINYPSKTKIAAGRTAAQTSILIADTGEVFEAGAISLAFPEAVDMEKSESLRTETTLAEFGGELETPYSLGLNAGSQVFDSVMNPVGEDRSRDAFRAGRLLAFDGHSDEEIAGILLNPDLPISGHFYDQRFPLRAVRRILEIVRVDTPYAPPIDITDLTSNAVPIGQNNAK